jgi:hypothetical protein
MANLNFTIDDTLKSIVAHAAANPKHELYGEPIEPSLWFVKDNGAYLMSPASPRQLREDGDGCVVAYAKGCDPNKDEDFYENARMYCGGDDFVEAIPLARLQPAIAAGATRLTVSLGADFITVETF